MEKFAVDLDKVLDEFELNEDRADEIAAGKETHPSGYREYLNATTENIYSYHDCVPLVQACTPSSCPDRGLEENSAASSVRYDFPYEPVDKINLKDADFASEYTLSSSRSIGESNDRNHKDAAVSQDGFLCSNIERDSKTSSVYPSRISDIGKVDVIGPDHHYPSSSQTLSSFSSYNSRNEMAHSSNAFVPSYTACSVLNINRMGSKNEIECSADRLMNDIETVMETGISLSALKFNGHSQEVNSEVVEPVKEPIASASLDSTSVNRTVFTENDSNHDSREHPVPSNSVEIKSKGKFEVRETGIKNATLKLDSKLDSSTDISIIDQILELQNQIPFIIAEEGNESAVSSSTAVKTKESSINQNQESGFVSKNQLKITKEERKESITSESNFRTIDVPVEIRDDTFGDPNRDIPVTSASVSSEEEQPVEYVNQKPTKIVGFSVDVEICDSELEKYLKDAEDNEKLELSNHLAGNAFNKKQSAETVVVNNLEDFNSTEFSSTSPALLENSLAALDPLFSVKETKQDDLDSSGTNGNSLVRPMANSEIEKLIETKNSNETVNVENEQSFIENGKLFPSNSIAGGSYTNTGARPKCLGDFDVNLTPIEKDATPDVSTLHETYSDETKTAYKENEEWTDRRILHDAINRELAQRSKMSEIHMVKEQQNLEIRNQLQMGTYKNKMYDPVDSALMRDPETRNSYQILEMVHGEPNEQCVSEMSYKSEEERIFSSTNSSLLQEDPYPVDESEEKNLMALKDASGGNKRQRPTSLNLSGKNVMPAEETGLSAKCEEPTFARITEIVTEVPPPAAEEGNLTNEQTSSLWDNNDSVTNPLPPVSPLWTEEESRVGLMAPFWIPDADASNCMQCNTKFTVIKRRHHCRACGRVLCSQCCASKAKLAYMENKEARVCQQCLQTLNKVQAVEQWNHVSSPTSGSLSNSPLSPLTRFPNPNNPNEYCSTVPPLQQAQVNANVPPPTVMVPVGVLKREGTKTRGEPKQVMFSDGIRPGGDLTELDAPVDSKPLFKRQKRVQKKIEKLSDTTLSSRTSSVRPFFDLASPSNHHPPTSMDLLPLVISGRGANGECLFEDNQDAGELFTNLEDPQLPPIVFAVNKNLLVHVKILTLDCCVKKTCWCFTTEGMVTVGQEELVIILECLPDEKIVPRDVFSYFSVVYEEANQGNTISYLGHTVFTQTFLGSKDHGGFLFIRPTFQCLNKLILAPHPYLVGILLQKWEIPWAKIFPLRLMLRLGYEFRFYPCPLISIRFRKPVYLEIGHTIMNLLADFRNYQYKLATIKGMVIHMEEKHTHINIPKNRYDEMMKALNNSNDHVLALGGNFSTEADSHLVCIQNEDGNYQTQAINIENKTRKVTGASFVVFNGALKSSTGLTAKSSIVEDGLMVQILADTMMAFRQSLRDMQDFTIGCGLNTAENPEEIVSVSWTDDDKQVNIGVRSPIDGMQMDGISSIHVHGGTDYMDEHWLIRWTEVFFIQTDDNINIRRSEPVNLSRLAEILAQACCIALTAHLNTLKEANLTKIGLRVNIDAENVGYEIGSRESKLPSVYMNDLDSELVPVIHRAASQTQEGPITLELVFHIMEQ